jgi:hypothetical protein
VISRQSTSTSYANVLSFVEGHSLTIAADTAVRRRETRANESDTTSGACSLGLMYRKKRPPRYITDRLSETVILEQIQYLQVFKVHCIELANELKTELVKEIFALVGNLKMLTAQYPNCFASVRSAQLLTAHTTLRGLQSSLSLSQKSGIVDDFASGYRAEVGEIQIDPGDRTCLGDIATLILFDCEDNKPAVSLSLDRAGLNLALNRTAESQSDTPNLRESQLVALKLKA